MHIEKVIITYGRMRVYLSFEDGENKYTTPEIANRIKEVYPAISMHSCINSLGPTFNAVIDHTSIAHLLEHLMIAEQSQMAMDNGIESGTFVGVTKWIDEESGIAEVQVSFIDDLDAATALSRSLAAINELCAP